MTIDEVKAFLAETKDDPATVAFLTEMTPKITPELFGAYLETEEGARAVSVHPSTDRRVTEAVLTATKKERSKIDAEVSQKVAAEMLKRNPEEIPLQKEVREMRELLTVEQTARARETLQRQLMEAAAKKGVDFSSLLEAGVLPASLEQGLVLLDQVAKRDAEIATKAKQEFVANGSYKPGSGDGKKSKIDLDAMTPAQMLELEKSGELDKILAGE